MTKLFKLTALVSAVFLLGACADETVLNPEQAREAAPESNAIQFGTYMGKSGMTRADIGGYTGSMTTEWLKGATTNGAYSNAAKSGFGVFAYYTGTDTYGSTTYRGAGAGNYPNFMYNEHVYWDNAAGLWKYDNTKYWPNEINGTAVYHWESITTPDPLPGVGTYAEGTTNPSTTTSGVLNGLYNNTSESTWFKLTSITYDSDVDDQNNDKHNDAATTDGQNGGNVTFFAYAPFVEVNAQTTATAIDGASTKSTEIPANVSDEGIINISGNAWVGAPAVTSGDNQVDVRKGDPYVTYVMPAGNNVVDLLWGTAGVSDIKANGSVQATPTLGKNPISKEGPSSVTKDGYTASPYTTTFANDILKGYSVNDNLNKMTTTGKVNFVFKHALAKMGGSYVGSGEGDDEDGSTPTNGLMVILDIDKDGAETGGSLQSYKGTPLSGGSKSEWNKYNTKVTINELVMATGYQLKSTPTHNPGDNGFVYADEIENLTSKGKLNLATGRWGDYENAVRKEKTQTTLPSAANPYQTATDEHKAADQLKDAILSAELAEPTLVSNQLNSQAQNTKEFFEALPIGVTTVAKNVYESEAQPLIFFPGTKPIIEFTITYTVRTYDPNLKNFYTQVKQKITKRLYITQEIELNKQYNILIHLGLTGVKFTATVSDWETTNVIGTITDPGSGGSPVQTFTEDIEHVYLPINVAGLILNETPKTSLGSVAGNIMTLTGATYHYTDNKAQDKIQNVTTLTDISFEKADGTALPGWITYNSSTGALTVTANDGFAPRTETIRAKYTNDGTIIYSDNITIKQYGRIASAATLATPTINLADAGNIKAAGGSNAVTLAATPKIKKYYDTDDNGKATGSEQTLAAGYEVDITSPKYSAASWLTPNTGTPTDLDAAANNKSTANRTTPIYVNSIPTDQTVTQSGFKLKLAVSTSTVTVTDGDDQAVDLTSGYTVLVTGGDSNGAYSTPLSGNTITVTGTGGKTYTVTVTHTASGATENTTVTL